MRLESFPIGEKGVGGNVRKNSNGERQRYAYENQNHDSIKKIWGRKYRGIAANFPWVVGWWRRRNSAMEMGKEVMLKIGEVFSPMFCYFHIIFTYRLSKICTNIAEFN